MPLDPGALNANDDFVTADCMAQFIEAAMPPPFDVEDTGKRGRREFFIALSTGIIEYLKQHDGTDFKITSQPAGGQAAVHSILEIL